MGKKQAWTVTTKREEKDKERSRREGRWRGGKKEGAWVFVT